MLKLNTIKRRITHLIELPVLHLTLNAPYKALNLSKGDEIVLSDDPSGEHLVMEHKGQYTQVSLTDKERLYMISTHDIVPYAFSLVERAARIHNLALNPDARDASLYMQTTMVELNAVVNRHGVVYMNSLGMVTSAYVFADKIVAIYIHPVHIAWIDPDFAAQLR